MGMSISTRMISLSIKTMFFLSMALSPLMALLLYQRALLPFFQVVGISLSIKISARQQIPSRRQLLKSKGFLARIAILLFKELITALPVKIKCLMLPEQLLPMRAAQVAALAINETYVATIRLFLPL